MGERIHLAANNPDLGGGEQMLLRHAQALLELGHPVTVVAADSPSEVLDAASTIGVEVVAIRADGRRDYLRRLRSWDRKERQGLLWCHGVVPALATAGHPERIIHLHQLPRSLAQRAALGVARPRSSRTLTPSAFLCSHVRHSFVCANWTDEVALLPRPPAHGQIGFLGRLSTDKGLDVLAQALASSRLPQDLQLLAAGDARWVSDERRAPVVEALELLGNRATMVGRMTPSEFLTTVDLAVFPSRVPESFGLVVAEAMAAGVPFVISDAGALPEVAGTDHPWVARRGDAEDLAQVIERALTATPEEVRSVTDRARLRWESEYSPKAGRLRVQQLLEELGVE